MVSIISLSKRKVRRRKLVGQTTPLITEVTFGTPTGTHLSYLY